MKKLFLALLAITGLIAIAPQAEAGQYARVYTNCGVTYVPKAALYGRSYTDQVAYNNYYNGRGHSHYRSHSRSHYGRSHYSNRSSRSVYSSRSCNTYRAPRIAFSFGF